MKQLIRDMKNCEQTRGLNVLEHGKSVHDYFIDIFNHVVYDRPLLFQWQLPEWYDNKNLWKKIFNIKTIRHYQIFHDCGKPYCLTIDKDGKSHFPDHANVSADMWSKHGHPP